MKGINIIGYVNVTERPSKEMIHPNHPERGKFVEIMKPGVFERALMTRTNDIPILVDHNKEWQIASLENGVKHLFEDAIGLRIEVNITDEKVIKAAKDRTIKGWSFMFECIKATWKYTTKGEWIREIEEIDLKEISLILNKSPAYPVTSWEIKGQPLTPKKQAEIQTDLARKQIELLKLRVNSLSLNTKGSFIA